MYHYKMYIETKNNEIKIKTICSNWLCEWQVFFICQAVKVMREYTFGNRIYICTSYKIIQNIIFNIHYSKHIYMAKYDKTL